MQTIVKQYADSISNPKVMKTGLIWLYVDPYSVNMQEIEKVGRSGST